MENASTVHEAAQQAGLHLSAARFAAYTIELMCSPVSMGAVKLWLSRGALDDDADMSRQPSKENSTFSDDEELEDIAPSAEAAPFTPVDPARIPAPREVRLSVLIAASLITWPSGPLRTPLFRYPWSSCHR